jgi:HK97 family phage portal protein
MLKAVGFPVWTGGTTDILPGGWGRLEYGNYGMPQAGSIAAVYGCWRVLCQTIGSVPWNVYVENKSGTRDKATQHPLYPILHDSPNAYMTSMEFREALILGFCSTGNGYAERLMLGKRVVGLNPLRADWMIPKMKGGYYVTASPGLVYEYHPPNGQVRDYQPEEIIHLKNFSLDGIRGVNPLQVHAIQHAGYTENYASNFMRNQGRPSGVLESPKPKPKDPDYNTRLSDDWKKLYGGDNAGSTAVLWDGMLYKQVSISPNDAQYIETKKLNAADIAAIYGVPLNMLAQSDKTATYASAEQFQIDFVRHTVRPLAVRLEQVINKALFAKEPGTFCEFDLDGLLRGDSKTQADYYRSLTDGGIMTRNEARRDLNLPERPEANVLTVRSYEIDLSQLPA